MRKRNRSKSSLAIDTLTSNQKTNALNRANSPALKGKRSKNMPVVDSPTSKQKPSASHLVSSPTPNQDSNNPANPLAPNAASINSLTISTMKTKKIKRNWIAICAIASLITSVIGTGGNLYLYYVQVNLQKEANLAHIEVDCPTLVCTDKLEIKNPGTAVARNVTVTLSIDTIQDNWKSSIDDISKFALTVTHTALNILVQKAQINTSANEVLNENAFILSLQSFPPDGKFDINLSLDYKKLQR